jgi:hypothetical protein
MAANMGLLAASSCLLTIMGNTMLQAEASL